MRRFLIFAQNLFPKMCIGISTLLPVINGYKPLNHRDASATTVPTPAMYCRLTTLIGPLPEEQSEFLELLKSVLDDRRVGEVL